ncbi:hypothetical protein VE00_08137 [Pseudogymnoascus sp. WSF 3629]|nr:hypothetical protein VE00_08137 [Pseudogymnoascus sp. WSF 3629]
MTSTGVKKRDSRFFATVLIQDEDEPEQDAADAGRSHANLPIMSAPQSDDTRPAFIDFMQYLSAIDRQASFPMSTGGSTSIFTALFQPQPHPQANQTRDKGKGRMEDSGYSRIRQQSSAWLPRFQSQAQARRARKKGKRRMENVPPQIDSLPDAPQASEPTSLGRFLVRLCSRENRERLGWTITAMRRVPNDLLGLVHLPWYSPDDLIVQRQPLELCRLKLNMLQTKVILRTAPLRAQDRKKALLYAVGAFDGEMFANRFEVGWRKYRFHIKLIDFLSAPGAIGDNLIGLALLLPSKFEWLVDGGNCGGGVGEGA